LGLPKKIFFKSILLLFLVSTKINSQELLVNETNAGFNIGLNLAFGTHFQRLGVNFHFYYSTGFFQANSEIRAYYNFRSLGPKFIYPELVLSQGVVFGYGPTRSLHNPFLNSVSNQTKYSNSIAYSYNAYFNKKKMSQQTGIIAFQFTNVSLVAENDLFAKPYYDRFRTAAFLLRYQYEDIFEAAVNCAMWTGSMGRTTGIVNRHFYYECYVDTTGGIYTNTSHGLLSAQVKYNIGYAQNVQANAGIDAEQVRNAMQNKFIHDMRWIPKKWNKARNCHIPMLDENGMQYLYAPEQKIRKSKVYVNLFSNANLFY
jgi:hypothetical protein